MGRIGPVEQAAADRTATDGGGDGVGGGSECVDFNFLEDGFYDVCTISSNSLSQGKMP